MPEARLRRFAEMPIAARWRARLARLADYGTEKYPPAVRRRLKIMNVTAYLIAGFTLIYTLQQSLLDFQTWKPVIYINLALIAVALAVPFLHRFGETVGGLSIAIAENIGLFALTYYLGRESGLHMQYFAAIGAYFVILGLERLRLIIALIIVGFALHYLAWALFPQDRALLAISETDIDALYVTAVVTTFSIISVVVYYAFRLADAAQAETDALLHNILPGAIVERLKAAPGATIADQVRDGSVLFADLKGFVPLAQRLGPARTVELLNTIVSTFDALAERCGVEKIKTIGDAYMVAAGVPVPAADHAQRIAAMALSMLDELERIAADQNVGLSMRIGIASGPILAGVIGAKRLTYDVWGDTVNLASRLEGHSLPGRVLVSRATKAALEERFALEPCGFVDIKGLGSEEAWFLLRPRAPGDILPAPVRLAATPLTPVG
jgi:adenylate cyclase